MALCFFRVVPEKPTRWSCKSTLMLFSATTTAFCLHFKLKLEFDWEIHTILALKFRNVWGHSKYVERHLVHILTVYRRMIKTGKLCLPLQDVAEDEIESEMGVVRTQLAYTYQLQGKNDDAQKLYNQVLKSKYVHMYFITYC